MLMLGSLLAVFFLVVQDDGKFATLLWSDLKVHVLVGAAAKGKSCARAKMEC